MDYQYKGVLVTGGAGFIGSHLAEALVRKGCEVTVLDNLSTGCLDNLAAIRDHITFIKGDITNRETLEKTVKGCDVIFHLAAQVSVPLSIEKPVESAHTNQAGALFVMEAARKFGARRIVLASSCAVYGDDARQPKSEDMLAPPLSPYALQKKGMEDYAQLYSRLYGLETVCLRYFNVYGPRQQPSSAYSGVISLFMAHARAGTPPTIYGDGLQTRDFIHVDDVVRANLLAAPAESAISGQVLNVGTGRATTITELWQAIAGLTGADLTANYGDARRGDIAASLADTRHARRALGFESQYELEEGLKKTLNALTGQVSCGAPAISEKD